jgi:putative inorganic carbon (HCO3(-)) transporter
MAASKVRGYKFWEALKHWDWLLMLAIAPLVLIADVKQSWVLVAILLVLFLQSIAWREILPLTPLNPAVLLLACMIGVSVFVTPDLASSFGKITGLLFGILVYYTAARHTRTHIGWKTSLILFSLAGAAIALAGVFGMKSFTAKIVGLNGIISKIPMFNFSLPGAEGGIQPNELAGVLLWIIPVILLAGLAILSNPQWFTSQGKNKIHNFGKFIGWVIFMVVVFVITTAALVLTQSRGSYLAIILACLAILVLIPRWPLRWWVIGLLGADLIGSLFLIQYYGWQTVLDQVIGGLTMDSSAISMASISQRVEIWNHAVWAIQDMPLTGFGMNIFRSAIQVFYPTFQSTSGYMMAHAHNELLQAALDLGIPGSIGFLALYVAALGMLARTMQAGGTLRLLALGLLGGLLAHFIFGMTDAVALGAKPGFLFWWLLGMVYGLYEQSRSVKVVRNE